MSCNDKSTFNPRAKVHHFCYAQTQKKIAEAIGKDKSVISRELKRNANHKGKYSFEYAQCMAEIRKERLKKPRKMHPCLKKQIVEMIKKGWSPQQIKA